MIGAYDSKEVITWKEPEIFTSPPKTVVPLVEEFMLKIAPDTNKKVSWPIEPVANTDVLIDPLWFNALENG